MSRDLKLLTHVMLVALVTLAFTPVKRLTLSVDVTALMPMPAEQLKTMVREAAALWTPLGVSFHWITARDGSLSSTTSTVRVLDDSCRSTTPCGLPDPRSSRQRRGPQYVGATFFVDGSPSTENTLLLSVDRLVQIVSSMRFADRAVVDWPSGVRDTLIGRAFGRVLAHELGHYLLGMREHATEGLMQPRFRADELIWPGRQSFQLPAAWRDRLEARLEALAAPSRQSGPGLK